MNCGSTSQIWLEAILPRHNNAPGYTLKSQVIDSATPISSQYLYNLTCSPECCS